jgi:hypothetical protein
MSRVLKSQRRVPIRFSESRAARKKTNTSISNADFVHLSTKYNSKTKIKEMASKLIGSRSLCTAGKNMKRLTKCRLNLSPLLLPFQENLHLLHKTDALSTPLPRSNL